MVDFKGKTAVITGGASGIGLGIATALADRGCNVVITDINVKAGEASAAKLAAKGVKALFIQHDVTQEADWDAMISKVKKECAPVDYAFNNAGIILQPTPLSELAVKDWQWIINVNMWGALFGLRKFTELMEQQDINGHIVTTASTAAASVTSTWVPYCVTKVAVLRMVEGYQAEANLFGKTKIKYSAVMPAVVYSNIGNSELSRPSEFATSDVQAVEQPNIQPGTPEGDSMGMITTELAVERILKQVSYGHTYIYTHRDLTSALILEEANSLLLNKAPTDQAVFNGAHYAKKAAR